MSNVDATRDDDEQAKRRKRRTVGTFPCSECSKVFTRSDHLARHYLNHQPKEVYVCEHIIKNHNGERRKCGKTFVRKDLRERHLKRHMMLRDSVKPENDETKLLPSSEGSPAAEIKLELPTMHRGSIDSVHSLHSPGSTTVLPPGIPVGEMSNVRAPNSMGTLQAPAQMAAQVPSQAPMGAPMPVNQPLNQSVTQPLNQPVTQQYSPPYPPVMPAMDANYPGQYNAMYPVTNGSSHSSSYISEGPAAVSGPQTQNIPINHNMNAIRNVGNAGNIGNTGNAGNSVHAGNQQLLPGMAPIGNITMSPIMSQTPKPQIFMGSPSHFKQDQMMNAKFAMNPNEMNRNNGFPQSQNDILLWLFMESPEMPTTGSKSPASHVSSTMAPDPRNNSIANHQFNAPGQRFDNQKSFYEPDMGVLTPFYHNPPEVNVGLQDLNFFLNSDNPLDEVFFRSQFDQNSDFLRERSMNVGFSVNPSTASSNSPTNTNESLTPKGSDLSLLYSEFEPFEKRLEGHNKANKPSNKQFYITPEIVDGFSRSLPDVTREKLNEIFAISINKVSLEDTLSFYLYGYWESFHTRFSILHKPSFDTSTCEPLLLLSMLLIGCMYCAESIEDSEKHIMCPEKRFCMLVAVPLRFTLFQHEDFKSPVKVWVLQSLNLLEWCEKNYLLRRMHERAHVHHGTTVQLLRRSPFLGGNPTVANKAVNSASDTGNSGGEEENSDVGGSDIEEASTRDQVLFRKWVDSESMKRITFMTFYLDVIDYIKFRHNPQIPFFQLQLLNLPCDEEALWNSDDMGCSFRKIVKRQRKLQKGSGNGMRKLKEQNRIRPGMNFLSALKKMMRSPRLDVRGHKLPMFTKSILFGGLVSIMHQMQQAELQNNFTLLVSTERSDKNKNQVWKDILTKVFDTWEAEMHSQQVELTRDPFFGIQKGQCKFPMYHLAQIVGISDINHYDIAIFGGSPRNQSVEATSKDMSIVQRKLSSIWSRGSKITTVNDLVNYKSVIHCYWLLWSLMLSPLGEDGSPISDPLTYGWRVDHDYYDVMYAVSIATLVLWCYTFTSTGIESDTFKDLEATMPVEDFSDYEKIRNLAHEDAYNYLFRIRQEFTQILQSELLIEDYIIHTMAPRSTQVPLYTVIAKYCELLPRITNKQNISGLCFLVGTNLLKSQWQVIRENAKLIINCGLRSVGKKNVYCQDLFDNNFS